MNVGPIFIPGSKSYTNRALIMAALTKGTVVLNYPLYSDDTQAMITCLQSLGIHIEALPNQILVHGDISTIANTSYELFVKDSGTTMRFLLALLCIVPGRKILRGNPRLNERPIGPMVNALRFLGARITYLEKEGMPPVTISSSSLLAAREIMIDASISSQYFSALLMIAPFFQGVTVHSSVLISKPYIEMTIGIMREWGIQIIKKSEGKYYIPPGQVYQRKYYEIEGDFSSAGYFFAIAALMKMTMTLKNLYFYSQQADRKFLTILEKMGNKIYVREDEITIIGKHILPLSLSMEDCPDQVQTMAVLAAFAQGITTISGVRSLRVKETERIYALKNELAKMGIKVEDTHDTLTIFGGNPHAAEIDTYGDHRMAMAFAVAKTKLPEIKIRNPEVVNKTFPTFWELINFQL